MSIIFEIAEAVKSAGKPFVVFVSQRVMDQIRTEFVQSAKSAGRKSLCVRRWSLTS